MLMGKYVSSFLMQYIQTCNAGQIYPQAIDIILLLNNSFILLDNITDPNHLVKFDPDSPVKNVCKNRAHSL